jgi:hypothetical protein
MTRGRCPVWLNEGLAQLMEGRSAKANPGLARLWSGDKRMPLKSLEGPFNGMGPEQATLAYAESLAAVQLLVDRAGLREFVRLLGRIGEGNRAEEALNSVYRLNYASLEDAIGASM